MLYDQAQLAWSYLELYQLTGDSAWADIARSVLDYVARDMTHPDGGFYSAEDADSTDPATGEHAEGAFYVWTGGGDRLRSWVTRRRSSAAITGSRNTAMWNRAPIPRDEFRDTNILVSRQSIEETAEGLGLTARRGDGLDSSDPARRLLEVRNERPRPHLDDKIITAWNGLMISAFARNFRALGRPD